MPAGEASAKLEREGEYRDSSGMFNARFKSWRETGPEEHSLIASSGIKAGKGQVAQLELVVPVQNLAEFQERYLASGSRLVLDVNGDYVTAWMTGRGELKPTLSENHLLWELDILLLVFSQPQRAVVKNGARQLDENGEVLAEITQVLSEEKTDWIAASEGQSAPVNLRVRMRLLCKLEAGKLTFREMPVEPKSILHFNFEGQAVAGTVVGQAGEGLKVRLNLHFPVLKSRQAGNLRPGVFLLDNSNRQPVATILQILDSGAPETPAVLQRDRISLARAVSEFRQVLVLASLDCSFHDGSLYVNSQKVNPGGRLDFQLFSEPVTCTVSHLNKLPAPGEEKWIEAEVAFYSIDPLLAELVKPGMAAVADQGEPDVEILAVLSNTPATVTITGYSGISLAEHPLLRDLSCKLKIKVTRRDNIYFYRGSQLMIGSNVSFLSEKFQLTGRVMSF